MTEKISKFEELKLSENLMETIKKLGYTEPTLIQSETIPLILKGEDVIGQSATGSGKTLAFAAGIIEKCKAKQGIQAIILTPTRELAEQVKDEIVTLTNNRDMRILAIYGGVSIGPQIKYLHTADVVIATPGRLLDHINRGTINTSKVKIFVLDEADRMVEMGFIEDVEKIMRACPKNKQTLLFSATMYEPAKKIAKKYMKNPITIHATKMVDPTKLKQMFYEVPGNLKNELLLHLLEQEDSNLCMVFCNTRHKTDDVVKFLKYNKIKAVAIHGGLNQVKRLKTIELFHKGMYRVLVCTDVAARGLHIENVSHIYNYDISKLPGDYVHRIGRTARAGNEGQVINFVSDRDYDFFCGIINTHIDYDIQKQKRPYLKKSEVKYNDNDEDRRGRNNQRWDRKEGGRGRTSRPSYGNNRTSYGNSNRSSSGDNRSSSGSRNRTSYGNSNRASSGDNRTSYGNRRTSSEGNKTSYGGENKESGNREWQNNRRGKSNRKFHSNDSSRRTYFVE